MNFFIQLIHNRYIVVPFLLWIAVQSSKVIIELIVTGKFNFKRIMGAGGMPSSHTAIVVSLTTLVGKHEGVGSAIFAVCLIFSLVVMYDATGVRRAARKTSINIK